MNVVTIQYALITYIISYKFILNSHCVRKSESASASGRGVADVPIPTELELAQFIFSSTSRLLPSAFSLR